MFFETLAEQIIKNIEKNYADLNPTAAYSTNRHKIKDSLFLDKKCKKLLHKHNEELFFKHGGTKEQKKFVKSLDKLFK